MKIIYIIPILFMTLVVETVYCVDDASPTNLLLGGIGEQDPVSSDDGTINTADGVNDVYEKMALDLNAYYVPMYNDGDADINEVRKAANGVASGQNGLNSPLLDGDDHYDTIISYSGGTATAITALATKKVKCDTLIMISPMAAGVSDETYTKATQAVSDCQKDNIPAIGPGDNICAASQYSTAKKQAENRYEEQINTILAMNPIPVKNIVVITATDDKVGGYISDVVQVKTLKSGLKNLLREKGVELTTQSVSLSDVVGKKLSGEKAHWELFNTYAVGHLSNEDLGKVEFNPEGNKKGKLATQLSGTEFPAWMKDKESKSQSSGLERWGKHPKGWGVPESKIYGNPNVGDYRGFGSSGAKTPAPYIDWDAIANELSSQVNEENHYESTIPEFWQPDE